MHLEIALGGPLLIAGDHFRPRAARFELFNDLRINPVLVTAVQQMPDGVSQFFALRPARQS